MVSDCSSRSSLFIVCLPGCRSNCSPQIRRLALLKRIPQNSSYLAVDKLKSAGSGIALKTKLSQFVTYEPLNRYSHNDRYPVADECHDHAATDDCSSFWKYVPNKKA